MTNASKLTPQHLTLLLRHSTHTILLSALPTTPLSTIKYDLLSALSSRGIKFLGANKTTVPDVEDYKSVSLGTMVDRKDWRKGFKLIREAGSGLDMEEDGAGSGRKGKGKANAAASAGKKAAGDTVAGAGLKDGDVVVFRFRDEKGKGKGNGLVDADDDEDEDVDMLDEVEDEGTWDVVWPAYEDEE